MVAIAPPAFTTPRRIKAVDMFCGGGGATTGLIDQLEEWGYEPDLDIFNHDAVALETHKLNHPYARPHEQDIHAVDPEACIRDGYADLLIAAPECRHFSKAKGNKPLNNQSRMQIWVIPHWCTRLRIPRIWIENVPEFLTFGPICTLPAGHEGKHLELPGPLPAEPCKRVIKERRGEYFWAWKMAMEQLRYVVEWRKLTCADYGDPTTRERLFIQCRNDGKPIHWPEPLFARPGSLGGFLDTRKPWATARDAVIDWTIPGKSLFDHPKYRKKPLALNTRRRVGRGFERDGGALVPYFVRLLDVDPTIKPPREVDGVLEVEIPSITTEGGGELLTPYMLQLPQGGGSDAHGVGDPLSTIATKGAIRLVQAQLSVYNGKGTTASVNAPLPTQPTKARFGLTQFILSKHSDFGGGGGVPARGVGEPLFSLSTEGHPYLIDPFLVPYRGEREGQTPRVHGVNEPLPAVTAGAVGHALVQPVILQIAYTQDAGAHSQRCDEPLRTLTTRNNLALAEPILTRVREGLLDPRRLVLVNGEWWLMDILFRMLTNTELARATSLTTPTRTYRFFGNSAQVTRQIGNAVPALTAKAMSGAALWDLAPSPYQGAPA